MFLEIPKFVKYPKFEKSPSVLWIELDRINVSSESLDSDLRVAAELFEYIWTVGLTMVKRYDEN